MTNAGSPSPPRRALPLRNPPVRFRSLVRRRLGEREFWAIQAGVAAVALTHLTYEVLVPEPHAGRGAYEGLHHIPVALYVIPVAYAGLAYGFEGGVLTGLWSAALTVPNNVLWHRADYEWLGEATFMLVVVALGAGMTLPAARERRQRRLAEAEARRLALVNELATTLGRSGHLDASVESALARVVEILGLEGASIGFWEQGAPEAVLVASCAPRRALRARLEEAVHGQIRPEIGVGPLVLPDGVVGVPLSAVGLSGALAVQPGDGARLTEEDGELLLAVGNQLIVAVDNLVLHQREQDHLRSYVQLATRAQEEERLRIAQDIHDEPAQALALIRRGLGDMARRAPDELVRGPLGLAELSEIADLGLDTLREFARDLRPATLDSLGLVPALKWVVASVERRSALSVRLAVRGRARRLAPDVEVAVFRAVQEALRNVDRHAEASSAMVTVRYGPETVAVEVSDDGHGFSLPRQPSELVLAGKLGITGMRERLQAVGGSCAVTSGHGDGTTVVIEAPAPHGARTGGRKPAPARKGSFGSALASGRRGRARRA